MPPPPRRGPGRGPRHPVPDGLPPRRRAPVWFFDLDDTLHDASHAMIAAIDERMTDYMQQHLRVERALADRLRLEYWHRYGATLLGLARHHGVDVDHFLRQTHDIDVPALLRAERGVAHLGRRLPGRKVLLTNAPSGYAARVLSGIGLHRHIVTRYAVEDMRVHGHYRPKPSRSMLRAMLVRERLGSGGAAPARAVLVDDNLQNLKAARAAGYSTVLFVRDRARAPRRIAGASHVMGRIRSIRQLPALAARLRAGRR